MNLGKLVSPNAVVISSDIKSKKRALELLAEKLAEDDGILKRPESADTTVETNNALDIFRLLTEREKLGSTGIGHGVALPHTRTKLTNHAIGAFLKLDKGVDFDSPDRKKADLIFALMVPEYYTDEHLKILAYLATLFSDASYCQQIRNANNSQEIYNLLINWQLASRAS